MNRDALDQLLKSPGLAAEDIQVVLANREFETARCERCWATMDNVGTPWAMGFVTIDGELVMEEWDWINMKWIEEWREGLGESCD